MPNSPEIVRVLQQCEELESLLVDETLPTGLKGTDRERAALTSFSVAIEHYRAIRHLIEDGRFQSSSRALMRPLRETCFRGMWLVRIATDAEVERAFSDDKIYPDFSRITGLLDKRERTTYYKYGLEDLTLFHGFTHTGYQQLLRHYNQMIQEPPLANPAESIALLRHAQVDIALFAMALIRAYDKPEGIVRIEQALDRLTV